MPELTLEKLVWCCDYYPAKTHNKVIVACIKYLRINTFER